jgi:hypothetical protein
MTTKRSLKSAPRSSAIVATVVNIAARGGRITYQDHSATRSCGGIEELPKIFSDKDAALAPRECNDRFIVGPGYHFQNRRDVVPGGA